MLLWLSFMHMTHQICSINTAIGKQLPDKKARPKYAYQNPLHWVASSQSIALPISSSHLCADSEVYSHGKGHFYMLKTRRRRKGASRTSYMLQSERVRGVCLLHSQLICPCHTYPAWEAGKLIQGCQRQKSYRKAVFKAQSGSYYPAPASQGGGAAP